MFFVLFFRPESVIIAKCWNRRIDENVHGCPQFIKRIEKYAHLDYKTFPQYLYFESGKK